MNFSEIGPNFINREDALKLSDKQKMEFFHNVLVKHDRVKEKLADIEALSMPFSGNDIVLLIGPTGVGKSAMSVSIKDQIIQRNQEEMKTDRNLIPVVLMEAPASGERSFSWRIFYRDLGIELNEPLMDKKIENREQDGRIVIRSSSMGSSVVAMRKAVENALKNRRTELVALDEAVHLIRQAKGNMLSSHMDALKSLANICGVTLMLIGSYDLFQLLSLSGQIARRTAIVHFDRYLSDNESDARSFQKTLRKLVQHLPVEGVPDLTSYADELHQSCIGCVGILKDTLKRALVLTLRNGGKWSDDFLRKALLSKTQLATILGEVLEGEIAIKNATFGSSIQSETPHKTGANA